MKVPAHQQPEEVVEAIKELEAGRRLVNNANVRLRAFFSGAKVVDKHSLERLAELVNAEHHNFANHRQRCINYAIACVKAGLCAEKAREIIARRYY